MEAGKLDQMLAASLQVAAKMVDGATFDQAFEQVYGLSFDVWYDRCNLQTPKETVRSLFSGLLKAHVEKFGADLKEPEFRQAMVDTSRERRGLPPQRKRYNSRKVAYDFAVGTRVVPKGRWEMSPGTVTRLDEEHRGVQVRTLAWVQWDEDPLGRGPQPYYVSKLDVCQR